MSRLLATITQDQNTDAGAGSSDKSQVPGPGTSIGQGSEYNETIILKKLNDLSGVAENTNFRDSVTGFKTVLEQQLQTTSPKPPNLSITLGLLKLRLEDPGC